MITKLKSFFTSAALIRFYRVTGYGIVSVFLTNIVTLVGSLDLTTGTKGAIILILTGIINAIDKEYRDRATAKRAVATEK